MKIYIAGSISGKTPEEVFKYFSETAKLFESWGYQVFSPLVGKGHLRTEKIFRAKDYRHPVSTNRAIFGRDRWMVGQSDIIYMNLLSAEIASIGSMMELAWGTEFHKHIVLVMQEDNIHQHAFVLQAADIVFDNTEDAQNYIKDLGADIHGKH